MGHMHTAVDSDKNPLFMERLVHIISRNCYFDASKRHKQLQFHFIVDAVRLGFTSKIQTMKIA